MFTIAVTLSTHFMAPWAYETDIQGLDAVL